MKHENGKKAKPAGPIVDRAAAEETSLNVLKRFDSGVEKVLAIATHVSLYQMAVTTRQWAKKNVEGSLFLVKRRGQPRFQLIVLNKLSTDIFADPVDGRFEFELNRPYLMYTKGNEEIIGIWFYEEDDIEHFSALLGKVCATLPKPDDSTPSPPRAASPVAPPSAPVAPPAALPLAPPLAPLEAATIAAAAAAATAAISPPGPAPVQPTAVATTAVASTTGVAAATASADHAALMNWIHRLEQPVGTSHTMPVVHDDTQHQPPVLDDVAAGAPPIQLSPSQPVAVPTAGNLTALLMQAQKRHQQTQVVPTPAQNTPHQGANGSLPLPNGLLNTTHNGSAAPPPDASTGRDLLASLFFPQQQVSSPVAALPDVASSSQAVPQPPLVSEVQHVDKPNKLLELLTKGREVPPKPVAPPTPPAQAPEPPLALSAAHTRDKLRTAIHRLLQNDAVVDLLAEQLREVGLL